MGINILIADDLQFIKLVLRDLLEKAGFRVVGEASNGEEAVELFQDKRPDVVLMDMKMAHSDGLSAAKGIREHSDTVGVVMITMHHSDIAREQALAAGVDTFVEKGIAMEDLVDAIRRVHKKKGQAS